VAINRATDLSSISNNLVLRAMLTERVATVMRPLVDVHQLKKGVRQIDLPTTGTVSIGALTDGIDLANPQNFRPTVDTFTASERGALVILTDKALRESQDNVVRLAGEELGNAMAEDFDEQLFAQFDSFTTNTLGSAATEPSVPFVLSAYALLYGNSTQPIPAAGSISYVGHTFTIAKLQSLFSWPGTSNVPGPMQSESVNMALGRGRYYAGNMFGMGIWHSPKLTVSTNAAKGAAFHKRALVVAEEKKPGVEPDRDASLRATEYVVVADFGVGIKENEWGVEMHFDATTPTGTTTV